MIALWIEMYLNFVVERHYFSSSIRLVQLYTYGINIFSTTKRWTLSTGKARYSLLGA